MRQNMDTNIVKIKIISLWCCLYVLTMVLTHFEPTSRLWINQVVGFYISGTSVQNNIKKVNYRIFFLLFFAVTCVFLDAWFPYYRKQFCPSFNKTWKLQFSALYLLKCLCPEYAQYKNPPTVCRQSTNYAIN